LPVGGVNHGAWGIAAFRAGERDAMSLSPARAGFNKGFKNGFSRARLEKK
jgi:hypothetical protein